VCHLACPVRHEGHTQISLNKGGRALQCTRNLSSGTHRVDASTKAHTHIDSCVVVERHSCAP